MEGGFKSVKTKRLPEHLNDLLVRILLEAVQKYLLIFLRRETLPSHNIQALTVYM